MRFSTLLSRVTSLPPRLSTGSEGQAKLKLKRPVHMGAFMRVVLELNKEKVPLETEMMARFFGR